MRNIKLISALAMFLVLATMAFAAPITGTVTATLGGVIPNAEINVTNTAGVLLNTAITNANGTYSVDSNGTGLRIIKAKAFGYDVQSIPKYIGAAGTTINFELGPIPGYTLSGFETNGLANVEIKLRIGSSVMYTTKTLAGGAYSIRALNGTYTFEASLIGYRTNITTVTVAGDTSFNFGVSPSVTTGTITGRVRNGTAGNYIPNAVVRLTMNGGTVMQTATLPDGSYSMTTNPANYNITASYSGFNDARQPAPITIATTTAASDLILTSAGTACTPTAWTPDPSTISCGTSFTQTSNCGTTRTSTGTNSCTSNTPTGGGGGGSSGTAEAMSGTNIIAIGGMIKWDLTKDGNPGTKTIRPLDSIVFVYDGTSYSIIVDEFSKDKGSIGFRVSPTDEKGIGIKGDEFRFKIKDKILVVIPQEITYDPRLEAQSLIKLRLSLIDGEPSSIIETVTAAAGKVKDGVINVAGEIAPTVAKVPVGVGISIATIVAGLLMFLGIRRIWS